MKTITFSVALVLTGAATAHASSGRAPAVVFKVADVVPPHFVSAPLDQQSIGGLLGDRMKVNLVGRLLQVDESGILDGFRHRPGKQDWIGEHVGKFLDAAVRTWQYTGDARLRTLIDRVARELITTQEADGYLGTYVADHRWTSWDVWIHKYDLMGLLAYHQATGDPASLAACRKIGDLLVATFGEAKGQRDLIKSGTHVGMAATSVLGPIVTLWRVTGDDRYLAFAKYVVRAIEQPNGPRILSTLKQTGSVLKTANAKAYEMISNLNGFLDMYTATGDKPLFEAALTAWQDIAARRLYLTGTASSREHFQEEGVLPGEVRANIGETCVTVNWLELNLRLLRLTGESRYADEAERTVYNHLLGAQDGRSGDFCYYTPLQGGKPFGHDINCCLSSGPRGISMIPELAWGNRDGAPAIVFYTPGRALLATPDGHKVAVTSKTEFPRAGRVQLTVDRSGAFPIALRVPGWTTTFTARVAGQTVQGTPGTFLTLPGPWKAGATITIDMDLPVRVVAGGKQYPDRVAVVRGPQVLTLDPRIAPTDVEDPSLVAVQAPGDSVQLRDVSRKLPRNRAYPGAQAYGLPGVFAISGKGGDPEEMVQRSSEIILVPYADARSSRMWLLRTSGLEDALVRYHETGRTDARKKRPQLAVQRTKERIAVDGKLTEAAWKVETPVTHVVRGIQSNQVAFGVLWDEQNLYVAVKVTDPEVKNHGTELWNTDSVTIAIEPPGEGAPIQLIAAWAHPDLEGSRVPNARHAMAATADGYVVEVAVPWTSLGTTAGAGRFLHFDICNTDSQPAPKKRNKLNWATPIEGLDAETTDFGELRLVASRP